MTREETTLEGDETLLHDMGSSLRRYLVDEFHFREVPELKTGALVLDLGGNRTGKRGLFDIERYGLQVVYSNLSTAKRPHLQAEASCLPFREGLFDAVICSELLEHVMNPPTVLSEIHRILRKGGTLLICIPFLTRIHGDPHDYGRYTDFYWSETLQAAGFADLKIEKQGFFWCVLMDMLRELALRKTRNGLFSTSWPRKVVEKAVSAGKRKALAWDGDFINDPDNRLYETYTTGFGIRARKE